MSSAASLCQQKKHDSAKKRLNFLILYQSDTCTGLNRLDGDGGHVNLNLRMLISFFIPCDLFSTLLDYFL